MVVTGFFCTVQSILTRRNYKLERQGLWKRRRCIDCIAQNRNAGSLTPEVFMGKVISLVH